MFFPEKLTNWSLFSRHPFLLRHILQMTHYVIVINPLEIIHLAARKNRRENLVFLCRGQYELGVCGRFLQRFQESVESRTREHVDLIDDIDLVLGALWRDAHLIHQVADSVHRIV